MIRKGVILGVVLLSIFSAIAKADLNPAKGVAQKSEDQIMRLRCCQYGGPTGSCVRWCPGTAKESATDVEAYEVTETGPEYSVDQFGFHCCMPGLYGGCWRWCLNAKEVDRVSEVRGETSGQYQGSRLRCCSWGPRNKCVRWC